MKKTLWLLAACTLFVGCQQSHPRKVFVDDSFRSGDNEKIAVFPFASSLHYSDDPDKRAPEMMDQLFLAELDGRTDYLFIAPRSVTYALQSEGLEEEAKAFVDRWRTTQVADPSFLETLAGTLQADAILLGVVDLWQKDEVDVQENATPTTYVGATVTILDLDEATILFQASDEDFLEGTRSEERSVIRSGSGSVRSDVGSKMYRAPRHEEVALKVVKALVSAIPVR